MSLPSEILLYIAEFTDLKSMVNLLHTDEIFRKTWGTNSVFNERWLSYKGRDDILDYLQNHPQDLNITDIGFILGLPPEALNLDSKARDALMIKVLQLDSLEYFQIFEILYRELIWNSVLDCIDLEDFSNENELREAQIYEYQQKLLNAAVAANSVFILDYLQKLYSQEVESVPENITSFEPLDRSINMFIFLQQRHPNLLAEGIHWFLVRGASYEYIKNIYFISNDQDDPDILITMLDYALYYTDLLFADILLPKVLNSPQRINIINSLSPSHIRNNIVFLLDRITDLYLRDIMIIKIN